SDAGGELGLLYRYRRKSNGAHRRGSEHKGGKGGDSPPRHLGSYPEIFFPLGGASLSVPIYLYSWSAGLVYGVWGPADLAAGEEVVMSRLALALLVTVSALAQRVELLWPDGAPGAVGSEDRDKPAITIYLPAPEKSSGAAVVICPGGGYGGLSMEKE